MNPFRSNSQRQAMPMAMLPLTAGTKYSARKMWMPLSLRFTMIASPIDIAMIVGVTIR